MKLLSVTFRLAPQGPLPSGWTGHFVQAWLLNWIRMVSPGLAETLHLGSSRRPYTVSPLVRCPGGLQFRVTAISPQLADCLDAFLEGPIPAFQLADEHLEVAVTQVIRSGFDRLLREAVDRTAPAGLDFLTPTTFHRKGFDCPLPVPSLILGSLLRCWNSFAPLPMTGLEATDFDSLVGVSRHRIRTVRVDTPGRGRRVAFVGRVQLAPGCAAEDAEHPGQVTALLRFAAFAGVGVGTAWGMGRTEPLERWPGTPQQPGPSFSDRKDPRPP